VEDPWRLTRPHVTGVSWLWSWRSLVRVPSFTLEKCRRRLQDHRTLFERLGQERARYPRSASRQSSALAGAARGGEPTAQAIATRSSDWALKASISVTPSMRSDRHGRSRAATPCRGRTGMYRRDQPTSVTIARRDGGRRRSRWRGRLARRRPCPARTDRGPHRGRPGSRTRRGRGSSPASAGPPPPARARRR
jgi:hypothetical protein